MKFARAQHTPLHRIGPEHQSLKSQMMLETRSHLVYSPPSSLERSFQAGLISAAQVTSLIQQSDCLPLEGFKKGKVTFSPLKQQGSRTAALNTKPYQHFPTVFEDSPVKGSRRAYNAEWTLPKLSLSQEISNSDLKSPRRKWRLATERKMAEKQRDYMDRLSQNGLYREGGKGEVRSESVEPYLDYRRTRNVLRLVRFPRRKRADLVL